MKEVTINGGYKAESHPATRHYKSETHSRGAKQFFFFNTDHEKATQLSIEQLGKV